MAEYEQNQPQKAEPCKELAELAELFSSFDTGYKYVAESRMVFSPPAPLTASADRDPHTAPRTHTVSRHERKGTVADSDFHGSFLLRRPAPCAGCRPSGAH